MSHTDVIVSCVAGVTAFVVTAALLDLYHDRKHQ